MQPYAPGQFNEVLRMINETAQCADPSARKLGTYAGEIAKELADKNAFDYVEGVIHEGYFSMKRHQ